MDQFAPGSCYFNPFDSAPDDLRGMVMDAMREEHAHKTACTADQIAQEIDQMENQ